MSERITKRVLKYSVIAALSAAALTSCKPNSTSAEPTPTRTSYANAGLVSEALRWVAPVGSTERCEVGIWDGFGRSSKTDVYVVHDNGSSSDAACPTGTQLSSTQLPDSYRSVERKATNDWNILALTAGADLQHSARAPHDRFLGMQVITRIGVGGSVQLGNVGSCEVDPKTIAKAVGDISYEGKHLEAFEILSSDSAAMCAPGDVVLAVDINYGKMNA